MKSKTYFGLAAFLFAAIAVGHLLRVINGWEVSIDDMMPPMWVSWCAVALGGYMAYWGYKLSK